MLSKVIIYRRRLSAYICCVYNKRGGQKRRSHMTMSVHAMSFVECCRFLRIFLSRGSDPKHHSVCTAGARTANTSLTEGDEVSAEEKYWTLGTAVFPIFHVLAMRDDEMNFLRKGGQYQNDLLQMHAHWQGRRVSPSKNRDNITRA